MIFSYFYPFVTQIWDFNCIWAERLGLRELVVTFFAQILIKRRFPIFCTNSFAFITLGHFWSKFGVIYVLTWMLPRKSHTLPRFTAIIMVFTYFWIFAAQIWGSFLIYAERLKTVFAQMPIKKYLPIILGHFLGKIWSLWFFFSTNPFQLFRLSHTFGFFVTKFWVFAWPVLKSLVRKNLWILFSMKMSWI